MNYSFLFSIVIFLSSCAQIEQVTKEIEMGSPIKEVEHFRFAWAKELDPVYSTGNFPIGTNSPFVFEDILYLGNLRAEMNAYDLETGRVLWSRQENGPIQSQVNKLGDYIYYGTKEGRLISRHFYSGKLKYSVDLGSPIESQPQFLQGRLILHLRNHSIIVLDARTGKVFWRYKRSVPFSTTLQRVSTIEPAEGGMLIGFADGYVGLLSLEEGVIRWEQKVSTGVKFVDVDVSPTVIAKKVVVGSASGPMRFLNPVNGVIEKTVEVEQATKPLLEDGSFLVGSTDGVIYRVSNQAKVLLRKKLSSNALSSVQRWKRGLVVTTMGSEVFYLDADTFKILDKFDLGSDQSAVFGQAVVADNGFLAIYSSRNRLYVFR